MRTLIVWVIVVFIALSACEDREPEKLVVPDALKSRLIELEQSGNCNNCLLQRWTYKEDYYYHLNCGDSPCLDCEVYLFDGTLVDWTKVDRVDYEANKHRPEKIWECGDEL